MLIRFFRILPVIPDRVITVLSVSEVVGFSGGEASSVHRRWFGDHTRVRARVNGVARCTVSVVAVGSPVSCESSPQLTNILSSISIHIYTYTHNIVATVR